MSSLTEDQQLVADSDEHVLCCALAGSGKSHTMIELTANLLKKDPSYKVLLITFTRAAAKELNERLEAKIPVNMLSRIEAATFDSIFGKQVKQLGGVKKRTLAGGEQYNFVERAIRHTGLESIELDDAMDYVDTYGRMLKAEPINGDATASGWQVFQAYIELMKRHNMQDFNSITRQAYLAVQSESIEPWDATHLLVDEFQDTSSIQFAWIQLHGELGAKVICVGDDDQSIYSWRGARPYENMINFQSQFNAKGYVLKICFRCKPNILSAAKRLIEFNEDRVYKDMFSGHESGGVVEVKGYLTPSDEMQAIVQAICSNNEDWAVLARTNRVLDEVEGHLKIHGIPYKRLGGKKLWDDNTANIFLKILWSLVRPKDTRFITEILGWLGEQEDVLSIIDKQLRKSKAPFAEFIAPSWLGWNSNSETMHQNWYAWGIDVSGKAHIASRMNEIIDFLKTVRGDKGKQAKLLEVVGDILTNLNVEGGFVDRVEVLSKNLAPSTNDKEEATEKGVVTLSSLHSSKGLQWSKVWIVGSNQGVCPSNNALEEGAIGGVPEERRLYYVGMTRAVDELYMSYNIGSSGVSGKRNLPSQFLEETFPAELERENDKLQILIEQQEMQDNGCDE